MCTVRIDIPCPGTFAPIASETPSSGCTCTRRTFGRNPSAEVSSNGRCGARVNWIAIVVAGTSLDADRLGDGDLHVVDELPVPDRLEDAVREPEHQHVLERLLAEVVVDPEDLLLLEMGPEHRVELARGCQVVPERLL